MTPVHAPCSVRLMLIDGERRRVIERDGACGPDDHRLFISASTADQNSAKAICENCQVREACLSEYFLEVGIVVGGTTWSERRTMLTQSDVPSQTRNRLLSSYKQDGCRGLLFDSGLTLTEATRLVSSFGDPDQVAA